MEEMNMKKKIVYSLLALMLCPLVIWAEDWSKLGFKGKVLTATVSRGSNYVCFASFTPEGELKQYNFYNIELGEVLRSSKQVFKNDHVTVQMKNGRLSKITEVINGRTNVADINYGKNGQLSSLKITQYWKTTTQSYVSSSSRMNSSVKKANQLKKALSQLKKGSAAYKQTYANYQAAVRAASVLNSGGEIVTNTQSHSDVWLDGKFSDYKYDAHGNWIARKMETKDGKVITEVQMITYEPEFLSDYNWKLTEENGDLDKVEEFFMDTVKNTKTYRDKAYEYWNAHILAEMVEKYNNASDKLTHAASSKICSEENREKLLVIAREQIYQQQVLAERDYVKLRAMSELSDRDMKIFNVEYQNKILARSQSMYEDSITYLQDKIANELANKQYEEARTTSLHALTINANNETFLKLRAEAEYQLLMAKKENNTVTSADYKQFRTDNPNSLYDAEVAKLYDRKYTRENRGRFYHIGAAGEISFGKGMFESTGGLGVRLGWHCSIINFYTGIQYGGFGVFSKGESSDADEDTRTRGGHFTGQHMTIPLMLRFNFARSFTDNLYVGLGANFNVATQAYLGYADQDDNVHHFVDKNFYNKSAFITPRFAFGYSGSFVEFEVFGLYELGDVVNVSLINRHIDDNPNYKFDLEGINKQYGHRFRGGLALRFMF